jgi:hypothetical protein
MEIDLLAIKNAETFGDRAYRMVAQANGHALDDCEGCPDIVNAARTTLVAAACEAVSTCSYSKLESAINRFLAEVASAIQYERSHGRLRSRTAFDRVSEWKTELARHSFGAAEKATLIEMLDNDDISNVGPDFIACTSGRSLSRQQLRDNCRHEIRGNLISDEKLFAIRSAPVKVSALSNTGIQGPDGKLRMFHDSVEA